MKPYNFEDYDGDEIDVSLAHSDAIGWAVYVNTAESLDKARTTQFQGVTIHMPQEVGIALPLKEAVKLRDYLTAAIAEGEVKQGDKP
jgi:hypothetical protein